MKLLSLSYERFRNLEAVSLVPSARATIAVGENGQGKTNLLEALYYLATLKPLRANTLKELVQFGKGHARFFLPAQCRQRDGLEWRKTVFGDLFKLPGLKQANVQV